MSSSAVISEMVTLAKECVTSWRHEIHSDVPAAVEELSECCEVLAEHYGEQHVECAEAYWCYGKALLEMSKIESSVLGNALEGFEIEEEEKADYSQVENIESLNKDERDTIDDQVANAFDDNFEKHDKIARNHFAEDSEEESSEDDEEEVEEKECKKTEEEKSSSEEIGHLEHAWEMLEMARMIYSKASNATMECEALACLGDISLCNENYESAIADLSSCLEKRSKALPADSRSIAETHYQLAVAHACTSAWSKAEASLASAVACIEARVASLRKMETSDHIASEIAELEALVSDIKSRVAEFKDMEKGIFSDYVVPSVPSGKLATGLGVSGSIKSAKPAGSATVGSA